MEKKLHRNRQEKRIAGVCTGLADYFDIDVTLVGIAFILTVIAGFSGFLAYVILWIVVPVKPFGYNTDYMMYEDRQYSEYKFRS